MTLRRLLTAGVLALLWLSPLHAATTLLPNGKQCFSTANGVVSGGFVNMYVPGTTTFKQTWQDSGQVTLNANPVPLDANGCAVIYGVGSYRQIVQDASLNTIWDQVTTDTSASNSVFIAGAAGGSPNAITVVDTGFNGTDGIISFIANATNTGATTLNPSSFGAIPIQKDSTTGPVSLTGGEIIAGNVVNVQFSATQNAFHILNLVSASATVPSTLCGATGLRISNALSSPLLVASITADQVVMTNPQGQSIARSNVSVTVNLTLNAVAGGVDIGGNIPNTWFNLYVIDNGITTQGLASQSAVAPTMPSGWSYRCRLGAMRLDGTGSYLHSQQLGADARWVVLLGSNVPSLPVVLAGPQGSITGPTWVPVGISAPGAQFAPPTATAVDLLAYCNTGAGQTTAIVAPSNQYGVYNAQAGASPLMCDIAASALPASTPGRILLETPNIFTAMSTAAAIISVGWHDKVNAN